LILNGLYAAGAEMLLLKIKMIFQLLGNNSSFWIFKVKNL